MVSVKIATVENLVVRYGSFTALNGLSCEILEGCTGLLGPNGAGKTTLIKTILGFVKPTSGTANVLGMDIHETGAKIRQQVGLMPEQDCHIPGMTAVHFVAYAGELAGMPPAQALRRAHEVLDYCGLGEARYRNVETFSTGMKQRIKLAQALVHGPKLLLLDEPTNGLDPAGREDMLELVKSVSHGKGLNVIVSSHLLPDIERICDRVVVVMKGQLRAQGAIKDLKKIEGQPMPPKRTTYRILMPGRVEETARVAMEAARETGAQIRGYAEAERSLEDAFLDAIGDVPPPPPQAVPPAQVVPPVGGVA